MLPRVEHIEIEDKITSKSIAKLNVKAEQTKGQRIASKQNTRPLQNKFQSVGKTIASHLSLTNGHVIEKPAPSSPYNFYKRPAIRKVDTDSEDDMIQAMDDQQGSSQSISSEQSSRSSEDNNQLLIKKNYGITSSRIVLFQDGHASSYYTNKTLGGLKTYNDSKDATTSTILDRQPGTSRDMNSEQPSRFLSNKFKSVVNRIFELSSFGRERLIEESSPCKKSSGFSKRNGSA